MTIRILDNSNIAENYPGVCSPMTCSFAELVYSLVFGRLVDRMGLSQDVGDVVDSMVATHQGRLYYRLDNWLRLLQLLPFSSRIIPVWKRSLAIGEVNVGSSAKLSWIAATRGILRLIRTWGQTPKLMDQLAGEFREVHQVYDSFGELNQHTNVDLEKLFSQIQHSVLHTWDVTLINDLRAFWFTSRVEETRRDVQDLMLASVEPLRVLSEIAESMDDRTREILEKLSTDEESRGWLNTELTDVIQERTRQAMGQYLQTFADRVPGELKLETKTFRTHPLGFIQVVLDTPTDSSTDHTLGAGDRLRSSRLSKKARQAVAYRESSRLARAQLFGMVRAIVRAVGENLVGAGHLDNVEDVFYLTIDELFTTTEDCPSIVAARQHQWEGFEEHDPPSRLLLDDQGQPHGSPVDADDLQSPSPTFEGTPVHVTTVAGIPVSVGVVEAEVVVVTDPRDGIDATGKILVARSTDPGWVFLMRQSVGIIAERGSLLSHAAIVARELGLPCVVGAPDVTTWLTTGDLVRLDGSTGHIEKMDGTHDR